GHVNETWRLFERWDIKDNSFMKLVTYLSTHPETGDRIVDMKRYAQKMGWQTDGEVTPLRW
ncbi:MAG: peptidase M48, partial [Gammaproteobacteria bacterium]|nr:peptidase M48 [Gammaproteobacteria bacterium]